MGNMGTSSRSLWLGCLLSLGGMTLAAGGWLPEKALVNPPVAQAQVSHPFSGEGIVYVASNGHWREAFIREVSGRTLGNQTTWFYTVQYLDNSRQLEANVTSDRIRTVTQAQRQGLTDNVYDLSTQAGIDQILEAHNQPRQAVGVPDLQWSTELATSAQRWADQLLATNSFQHSPATLRNGGRIGENLASRSSSAPGGSLSTPARAIAGWVDEQSDYNYATNSCTPGKMCGHYTQMVWAETTEVGCALARNANATREVWVCHYSPSGNVVGQRPY